MEKKTIVLGVIGSDCHAVGNKILDYSLSDAGFNIVNIGVLSPQEDFINAAIETNADAILVSSLYGHGEIDCRGMRANCDESGLKDVLLYVGGNIVVGKQDWEPVKERFEEMGFDRVYPPGTSVDTAIRDLQEDFCLTV
nr:methylaspartate mutase subunit S [Tissierella sp.]